ncbi:hydrogenase [Persephonella sp.]
MSLSDFIELVGAFVLVFAILQIASDRLFFSVKAYAVQSFFVAVSISAIALYTGFFDLYITAVLTFLIKVLIIPLLLIKLIEKIKIRREIEPFININYSLLITGTLVIFSFFVTQKVHISGEVVAKEIFPISIAVILIGAFIMISRKKAVTQIIGFLTLENGIMLAGTSITKGMPLIVEIGVFFDVFVGALMAGILIYQIRATLKDVDTAKLTTLKE